MGMDMIVEDDWEKSLNARLGDSPCVVGSTSVSWNVWFFSFGVSVPDLAKVTRGSSGFLTSDSMIPEIMGLMTDHRIRHLPIVEAGQLVGLISIGDVVKAQHDELTAENHYLKEYIQS